MTVPAGTGALEATQQQVLSQLQSGLSVSVTSSAVADTIATGTLTAAQPTAGTVVAGGTVSITLGTGQGTWEAQLTGTFSSGTTVLFEGTDDAGTTTNWFTTVGYNTVTANPPNITSVAGPGPFVVRGSASGYQQIRMRASALTVSDSVSVRLIGSNAPLGLGGLSTNDGSFAKETGGNLASIKSDADSIVTNTTGLATQTTLSAAKTDLDSILTHEANIDTATAASKTDLDTIVTNTSNASSALGTTSDAAWSLSGNATLEAIAKKIALELASTLTVQQTDTSTTGSISAAQSSINTPVSNATVQLAIGQGQSTWKAQLLAGGGGFTSGTTLVADKSPDGGTTWYSTSFKVSGASPNTPVSSVVGPAPIELTGNCSGVTHVRIRCSVLNSTETVAVTLRASVGTSDIGILSPLPAGSNVIGSTTIQATSGTALLADQSNTELRASIYGKNSTAGDTPLLVDSTGRLLIGRNCVAVYTLASTTTSGTTQNSGDLTVGAYTEISIDINTTAQAGTNPAIQYYYERKAADGIYYVLWQSASLTSATNTISTSVGVGMAYNQSLGATGRIRWVIGGTATPTFTHTINIQGK